MKEEVVARILRGGVAERKKKRQKLQNREGPFFSRRQVHKIKPPPLTEEGSGSCQCVWGGEGEDDSDWIARFKKADFCFPMLFRF